MVSMRNKIILLVILSVFFVTLAITGIFFQDYFTSADIMIDANSFSVVKNADGQNEMYIPFGLTPPDIKDVNVINVESPNASLVIETPDRKLITEDTNARIIFLDGKGTDYGSGLINGSCTISETNQPKISGRSYEINLLESAQVLGMNTERDWLLLSLENDKSLLRTYAGLELSKLLGMTYTPELRFLEVFVNGSYGGTYILCEKIKISHNRLDIDKASNDIITGDGITGGYLMLTDMSVKDKQELNKPVSGKNFYFNMNNSFFLPGATERSRLVFKQTKSLLGVHFEYIKNYMTEAENVLFSDNFKSETNGFRVYFNEDNVINWYIIEEIFKNPNDPKFNSTYLYKERNGGISLGPVWYFGYGAGNSDFIEASKYDGWYVREASWISRMFEDEKFIELFKYTWESKVETLEKKLCDAIGLKASQQVEAAKYKGLSYDEYWDEVDSLKNWISERIKWISNNIN